MRIISFFCFLLFVLNACTNTVETVEGFDDNGKVLERYTRKIDDYSRHGLYTKFYENGRKEEEAYFRNDTLNGQRILFYESGDTLIVEHYKGGVFTDFYKSYFQNGKTESKGLYLEGAMNGTWEFYYDTGQLKELVLFKNNEENGPFEEYHKNGNIKAKGTYKTTPENVDGNKEHGLLELYSEQGELERKMDCQLGICRTIWTKEDSQKKI